MDLGTFFLIAVFIAGIVALVGYQQGWFNGDSSCNSNSDCSDGETCTDGECTQDGGDLTCKDYTCDEGWIDKDNKNNITCDDECTNSKCCSPDTTKTVCSERTCESPKVLISNAENVLCNEECANCCENPTCSTLTKTCSSGKCPDPTKADNTVEKDYDTDCCKDKLTCNDYLCSSGWMKRVTPENIDCDDCNCTDETCCLPTCSTGSTTITCQDGYSLRPDADNISFDSNKTNDFQTKCCSENTVSGCRGWFDSGKECEGAPETENLACTDQSCPRICCPNDRGTAPQCCSLGTADEDCYGVDKVNCKDKCFWQDKINPDTSKYDCDYLPTCVGSSTKPYSNSDKLKEGKLKSCEIAYTEQVNCNHGHYVPRRINPGNTNPKYDKTVGHQCEWDSTKNSGKGKCVTLDTWCKIQET